MEIIIDRKWKRKGFDDQYKDVLGVEDAKRENARTLEIDKKTDNIIEKYILKYSVKYLLGKKVWCIKSDKSRTFCGWVVDVYPSKVLLVKVRGKNLPMTFDSVISMEA